MNQCIWRILAEEITGVPWLICAWNFDFISGRPRWRGNKKIVTSSSAQVVFLIKKIKSIRACIEKDNPHIKDETPFLISAL
jgi:hypothetical protein